MSESVFRPPPVWREQSTPGRAERQRGGAPVRSAVTRGAGVDLGCDGTAGVRGGFTVVRAAGSAAVAVRHLGVQCGVYGCHRLGRTVEQHPVRSPRVRRHAGRGRRRLSGGRCGHGARHSGAAGGYPSYRGHAVTTEGGGCIRCGGGGVGGAGDRGDRDIGDRADRGWLRGGAGGVCTHSDSRRAAPIADAGGGPTCRARRDRCTHRRVEPAWSGHSLGRNGRCPRHEPVKIFV